MELVAATEFVDVQLVSSLSVGVVHVVPSLQLGFMPGIGFDRSGK